MLDTIKNIFNIVKQIMGIYSMIISLVEMDSGDLEGSEKEEKAINWIKETIDDLVEYEVIPEWAANIFFNEKFARWVISILVKAAHELGIFKHKEELEGEKKREV